MKAWKERTSRLPFWSPARQEVELGVLLIRGSLDLSLIKKRKKDLPDFLTAT
jgi:hypothetical protein